MSHLKIQKIIRARWLLMESLERLNGSEIGFKRQEEVESWIPRKVQPISSESLELVIEEQQSNEKKGQQWPICITM